jgi:GNAT superfamily N-acetyltransferase
MDIRPILNKEQSEAMDLVWKVFLETGALGYSKEAINSFRAFLHNESQIKQLMIYGAFAEQKIIGVLAVRNPKQIALFFIAKEYQKKGIGRALFDAWLSKAKVDTVNVNSALFSVDFYRRLGFIPADSEQFRDGIRYLPMIFQRNW